jgi:DHA1 family tetracycline resistance protein-like MFS transporter
MTPDGPSGTRQRAAFAFIFITVALDMLALGIMVPVLPKLILRFEGGNTASAAQVAGVFGFAWALMQFVFSPVLGALSDRFGRRPVVLASNFGLGLDYLLMALAPSLGWLFVGRVVSGITSASFSTAGAYIADVTPPEQRAARFGLLGAAFGLGFVVGPAVGGLLGAVDLRLPFWVAAGLSLANAGYGLFVLPESLPVEKRAGFSFRRASPFGSLALLRSHPELFGLAGAALLSFLAHDALPSVFVLYTDHRYHWSEATVGLALAVVGVCTAAIQGGLVGRVVGWMGPRSTLLLGLAMGVVGYLFYGLAPVSALFFAGIPFVGLWGMSNPTTQSLMSQRVGPSEQGQLQGALSSLRGITGMIGPLLFTQVFAFAVGGAAPWLPGVPYLLGALLLVVSLLVAARVTRS